MPEDSLYICYLPSFLEDFYCGSVSEGVGGKLLSVQTYTFESLLAYSGDSPGCESLPSVLSGVGDKERVSGLYSFSGVEVFPDREVGLICEDYKRVFLCVSLSPDKEYSFLPLKGYISHICPDYLYSAESSPEEEVYYCKVPEGFLLIVLQEFPTFGL